MVQSNHPPLYTTLAQAIKSGLLSGGLRNGDAIPTEATLAKFHDVSRTTVRSALQLLQKDGLIQRRQGSGTYFCVPGVSRRLASTVDYHASARAAGKRPYTKVLGLEFREPTLAEFLVFGIDPHVEVAELRRLRHLNEHPAVLQVSVLRREDMAGVRRHDLENVSLYRFLEKRRGIEVDDVRETLEPFQLDSRQAEILNLPPGSAVFRSRRIAKDEQGRVVEISDNLIRGDFCRFTLNSRFPEEK